MVVKCLLDSYLTENDISVNQLSEMSGISELTLKKIMSGKYEPSVYVALLLSICLNCEVTDIFSLDINE